MPDPRPEAEFESQDQAETYDETNYSEDDEFTTLEEFEDVLDVTQAEGDDDEDEFDEDSFDDDDLEEDDDEAHFRAAIVSEEEDEDLEDRDEAFAADEIDGLEEVRDADGATGGEDDFTNFQSRDLDDDDLRNLGYLNGAGGSRRG